jgi:hypothetical protein
VKNDRSNGTPVGFLGTGMLAVEITDVKDSAEQREEVVIGCCPSIVCIDLSARRMRARHFYQGFR